MSHLPGRSGGGKYVAQEAGAGGHRARHASPGLLTHPVRIGRRPARRRHAHLPCRRSWRRKRGKSRNWVATSS
ncbi:hypothetical protein KL86PLE_30133 [uncultured Pleomorphomonas sp.]|uniref:Uncharacterized protein n=1 Tax=uncultured Pleomorphomonas sp. TaxID=442121 RepID=A0A212LDN5_9HYPH|nr:hypothetical protein KL86PLE_30133 [uncultured Pleomorphomonas sp.]